MRTPAETPTAAAPPGTQVPPARAARRIPRLVPAPERAPDTRWLDLVRVLAIVAVVVIHAVAPVVEGKTTSEVSATWWAADVLNSAMRWCVPAFVMVSGALLLDPRRPPAIGPFYRRRLQRVGIPLLFWTAFYLAFRKWYYQQDLSAGEAAKAVVAGTPFLQLYFLFVVVGLYLLTPFLRVLVRSGSRTMTASFAAGMLGLGVVDQVATMLAGAGSPNAVTRFLPYVGYYVAGWVLRDFVVTRRVVVAAAAAFVAAWIAVAVGTAAVTDAVGWSREAAYLYAFLSPPVVVMSLAAFVLLRALGTGTAVLASERRARLTRELSDLSFGVFLVHPAVLIPLRRATGVADSPLPMLGTVLGLVVVSLVVSGLVTLVLRRLPLLERTV